MPDYINPYVELYRSRRAQSAIPPRQRPRGVSLLEQTIMDDRDNMLRVSIMDAPAPEQIARETRVARAAGQPPAMVGDVDYAEKAVNANRLTKVFGRYPALGRWGATNLRGAATAQDDQVAVGMLGRAFEGVKNVGHRLTAGAFESGAGLLGNDDMFDGPLGTANPIMKIASDLTMGYRAKAAETMRSTASSQREQGRAKNWYADTALSGVESIPIALAATLTRNPTMAAAIPAISVRGSSLAEAKRQGLSGAKAQVYSVLQGGTEFLTEKISAGRLVNDLIKGTGIGKTIIRQLGAELPGEQVATAVQDLTDWAMLPENNDKTFGEYVRARPQAALSTAIATSAGTMAQSSLAVAVDRSMRAAGKVTDRVYQASQARRDAQVLDRMGKAAQASKFRTRDPEGFAGMIGAMSEETGATHIYIGSEAMAAYAQTDAYEAG